MLAIPSAKKSGESHVQGTEPFIHLMKTYGIMSARPKEHWNYQSMTKRTYD